MCHRRKSYSKHNRIETNKTNRKHLEYLASINNMRHTGRRYVSFGVFSVDEYGTYTSDPEDKVYYKKYYRPKTSKYYKKFANRKVRRYKGELNYGDYKRISEYWWNIT